MVDKQREELVQDITKRLFRKLVVRGIPERMHAGIVAYVLYGQAPGGFLAALLKNNLLDAFTFADAENKRILERYSDMLVLDLPADCCGSEDAFRNWLARGGLVGK